MMDFIKCNTKILSSAICLRALYFALERPIFEYKVIVSGICTLQNIYRWLYLIRVKFPSRVTFITLNVDHIYVLRPTAYVTNTTLATITLPTHFIFFLLNGPLDASSLLFNIPFLRSVLLSRDRSPLHISLPLYILRV